MYSFKDTEGEVKAFWNKIKLSEKVVKKNKGKLVADIYHVEDYGKIATFEDIDGNYFQLAQVRP